MTEDTARPGVETRRRFFDTHAPYWDSRIDGNALAVQLARDVAALSFQPGYRILDLGCGTGNLALELQRIIPPGCLIAALDLSREMLRQARRKPVRTGVIGMVQGDAFRLPFPAVTFQVVLCYSTWPHLEAVGRPEGEVARVLAPGGRLQIWHSAGRERIREIHAAAGPPVEHDLLPPADRLAERLEALGFRIERREDTATRYLVRAVKVGSR